MIIIQNRTNPQRDKFVYIFVERWNVRIYFHLYQNYLSLFPLVKHVPMERERHSSWSMFYFEFVLILLRVMYFWSCLNFVRKNRESMQTMILFIFLRFPIQSWMSSFFFLRQGLNKYVNWSWQWHDMNVSFVLESLDVRDMKIWKLKNIRNVRF